MSTATRLRAMIAHHGAKMHGDARVPCRIVRLPGMGYRGDLAAVCGLCGPSHT